MLVLTDKNYFNISWGFSTNTVVIHSLTESYFVKIYLQRRHGQLIKKLYIPMGIKIASLVQSQGATQATGKFWCKDWKHYFAVLLGKDI